MGEALRRAERWPTTPIENVLQERAALWSSAYTTLLMRLPRPLTDLHEVKLGTRDYTFTGEFRFHVWDRPDEGWRVFVSNKKGVCFEVAEKASPEAAWTAWESYARAIG